MTETTTATNQAQIIDNETGEIITPTNQLPTKSRKQFIDEMVYIVQELEAVNESLKELKSQAKEYGYNPALLMVVAKALASDKVDELQDKTNDTLEILDEVLGD